MEHYHASLLCDARCALGEGPLWDDRTKRLYWVDIEGYALHILDGGIHRSIDTGEYITCLALNENGSLTAGLTKRIVTIDTETGEMRTAAERTELPESRFNDGKAGPDGRLWVGTMSLKKKAGEEKLYTLDAGALLAREHGITTSNGIAWSLDQRTMYYIDTPTMQVVAYDFDSTSGISRKRTVITFRPDDGRPDGMCIDSDGMLWIAHWGGGCVTRHDASDGSTRATIDVPSQFVTACCFGGDALTELYITTARKPVAPDALAAQPHAGGIFSIAIPGVHGTISYRLHDQ